MGRKYAYTGVYDMDSVGSLDNGIVLHENTAKTIAVCTKILDNYDPWLLDLSKEDVLKLTPFENSQKTKQEKQNYNWRKARGYSRWG